MSEYVTWQRRISVIDFILFTYLQVSESVQATVSLRAWQDDGTGWHIRLVQWPSARVKTLLQLLTLSPGRPRFGHSWVCMEFVVDKVALRQVVLRVLRFSPVIIPPVFHTHHLNVTLNRRTIDVTLNRRTTGRCLGTFKQSRAVSDIGEHWTEQYFQIISSDLQTA